jgi:hypothetical protein
MVSANYERSVTIGLLRERVPAARRGAPMPPDFRRLANRAGLSGRARNAIEGTARRRRFAEAFAASGQNCRE